MDSLRGQGGIQMLLTAEQEAGRIVSAARTAKLARMKQAKDEAEKEMEEYRSRLEEEYQTQISGTEQEAAAKRLEEETDGRIQNLKESSSNVSKEIVKMLIKYVIPLLEHDPQYSSLFLLLCYHFTLNSRVSSVMISSSFYHIILTIWHE
ncbi:BnaC06g41270D [Brassica napus]|uniref:V-type proton ATPase subunit G n=3 Tax=Brassica TaxID=3705 RepID=A0A078J4B1_BRANA|nr:unnamed protein product [Brassica napus]CDY57291.1 BnaC06g41270D [Brassica napus]